MRIKINLNTKALGEIGKAAQKALKDTADVIQQKVVADQTMPRRSGDMQDDATSVETDGDSAFISTSSPQARRLYYHPEYNFFKGHNPNAGAEWWEPYADGTESDFIESSFAKILEEKLK